MRTITFRRVNAIKWEDDQNGNTTGLIKVEILTDNITKEVISTQYFTGKVKKTDEPYKDALEIIATGRELTESEIDKLNQKES